MSKAYIVGEKQLILGFKGIGFEVVPVSEPKDLAEKLFMLTKDSDVGLVLVTESMAEQAPAAIEEFRSRSNVILTVIPTHEGSLGIGYKEMRNAIERSIGIDLFKKEEATEEE